MKAAHESGRSFSSLGRTASEAADQRRTGLVDYSSDLLMVRGSVSDGEVAIDGEDVEGNGQDRWISR